MSKASWVFPLNAKWVPDYCFRLYLSDYLIINIVFALVQ